jgi:hypothetical protein
MHNRLQSSIVPVMQNGPCAMPHVVQTCSDSSSRGGPSAMPTCLSQYRCLEEGRFASHFGFLIGGSSSDIIIILLLLTACFLPTKSLSDGPSNHQRLHMRSHQLHQQPVIIIINNNNNDNTDIIINITGHR